MDNGVLAMRNVGPGLALAETRDRKCNSGKEEREGRGGKAGAGSGHAKARPYLGGDRRRGVSCDTRGGRRGK